MKKLGPRDFFSNFGEGAQGPLLIVRDSFLLFNPKW